MVKAKASGVWKSFLLSFLLPIVGGLIVYIRNRRKNEELANICSALSILYLPSAIVVDQIAVRFGWFIGIVLYFFLMLALIKAFEDNKYRYFIPPWYFGLFGAIFSYYYAYKKNEQLRRDVDWFFLSQLLILVGFLLFGTAVAYMYIASIINS